MAKEPDHRPPDIAGVLILAVAVVSLLSLILADTGIIGQALSTFFRTLFGLGAWVVPVLLGLLGFATISGKRAFSLGRLSIGLSLLFLAILGTLAREASADFFDYSVIGRSGGFIGAVVGYGFTSLLGSAKMVGLIAMGLVGVILSIDRPLKVMFEGMREKAQRAQDRVTRPKTLGVKPTATRAVVEAGDDRATRRLRTQMSLDLESETATRPTPEEKTKKTPIFRDTAEPALSTDSAIPKEGYELPPLSLLAASAEKPKRSQQEMQRNIETLEGTLEQFGIDANVVEVATGPTVTRYEIQLGPGVRVARIVALADNIAMDLAANQVRVEAPIPGKAAIGVEVPNSKMTPVFLRELCETKEFIDNPNRLTVALGQDVSGKNQYADLTRMPHLLICGATNSGKSIGIATLVTSLLMRNTPKDLRLVMIDPKRVELTLFDGIPHLMCPVVKDVKEAAGVLRAVWREMDRRYDVLSEEGVRNIDGWNERATFQDKMPYIVVIIDELADLMIAAKAEVETTIVRLAQLARAVGIHIVIATQRPSVDVITGIIKANIPSRIAFAVSSQIDSRTILDQKGAEDLIGRGDMLYMPIGTKPVRVQGCYVSEKEIERICQFWRAQETPVYSITPAEEIHDAKKESGDFGDQAVDPLWEDAVRWAVERGQASTSMLQRKFSIGFQRASRLLDQMEERQIVGARDGPRPREVLVNVAELDAIFSGAGVVKYDTDWLGDE